MIKKQSRWLIPLLLMILITPFTPFLDLTISSWFYNINSETVDHFVSHPFLDWVYTYGLVPGQILGVLSAVTLLLSYVSSCFKKWRLPALLIVLTLAVGAGFISHVLLKDHWGRPRPRQAIEFSGSQPFRPYYSPNLFHQPEPSKSFVCGHCTMGFIFFALALVGKRIQSQSLYYTSMALAFLLGSMLGITRIMQGGHFFSDVLWSGLIMWFTALTMDWLIYNAEEI